MGDSEATAGQRDHRDDQHWSNMELIADLEKMGVYRSVQRENPEMYRSELLERMLVTQGKIAKALEQQTVLMEDIRERIAVIQVKLDG